MSETKLKKQHCRRYYSENFKKEAVATYEESGKSRAEICQSLDISCSSLLKNWSVLYSAQKRPRKSNIAMIKDTKSLSTSETITKPSNSTEAVQFYKISETIIIIYHIEKLLKNRIFTTL
jgi:transposase-like protein